MLSMVEKLNAVTKEDNDIEVEPFNDDIDPHDGLLDTTAENSVMLSHIEHMRCTVHTLQFLIRDGLKEQHSANLFSKFREVATFARTPKIDSII